MSHQNNKKNNASPSSENPYTDKLQLVKALKNPLRLDIILRLLIYNELSMTQLSQMVLKSKPTIHRHTKKLISMGIIETSKEKKVRGSIKAKYFSLTKDFLSRLKPEFQSKLLKAKDLESYQESISDYLKLVHSAITVIKHPLELLDQIVEYIDGNPLRSKVYFEELKIMKPSIDLLLLNEKQYSKIREKMKAFYDEIQQVTKNNENGGEDGTTEGEKDVRRPYILTTYLLQMEKLLELQSELI